MTLPSWREHRFRKATGEDHLGVLSVGIAIASNLLPGINTVTPRARYFSFYSWVLYDFLQQNKDKSKELFKQHLTKREFAYVLANLAVADHDKSTISSITGITHGAENWKLETDILNVNQRYVKQPLGGYAIYRGAMDIMHLIKRQDDFEKVDMITQRGIELAREFESSIQNTQYFRQFLNTDEIPRSVLLEYGMAGGLTKLHSKPDAKTLIFTLTRPDRISKFAEVQRRETMGYILHILSCNPMMKALSGDEWRDVLYKHIFPNGTPYVTLPELQYAQNGWYMYQLRQYFGFAMETILCHLLEELRVESSSIDAFCEKKIISGSINLKDVEILFDPSAKIEFFLGVLPTFSEEACIATIRGNKLDTLDWKAHFATPITLLMILYKQLVNLKHNRYAAMFAEIGGDNHLSLKKFVNDVDQLLQKNCTLGDFCRHIIDEYVVRQHHSVAIGKLLGYNLETFRFIDNDGRLEFITHYWPNFNLFRVEQLIQVMHDLGMIKSIPKNVVVTDLGQKTIQDIAQLAKQVKDRTWGEDFGSIKED